MMKRDLTDISEELTSAIMQGDGATALDLFAEYAERADEVMVELARDLRHMTEERDTISSAWDELHAELTTARAQLDAAVQYEIAHKLRTGDYERIDTPPQE